MPKLTNEQRDYVAAIADDVAQQITRRLCANRPPHLRDAVSLATLEFCRRACHIPVSPVTPGTLPECVQVEIAHSVRTAKRTISRESYKQQAALEAATFIASLR